MVELLVAVALAAILASLLLPAVCKAGKRMARKAQTAALWHAVRVNAEAGEWSDTSLFLTNSTFPWDIWWYQDQVSAPGSP